MTDARAFRGFRFPAEVILWAVRWYLQFPISVNVVWAAPCERADIDEDEGPGEIRAGLLPCVIIG